MLHQGRGNEGLFLDVCPPEPGAHAPGQAKLLFALESPPPRNHLTQLMEVFKRLDLGVRRSLTVTVATGTRPYFLGSFEVAHRGGRALERESELFKALRRQLYGTQILSTSRPRTVTSCSPGS